LNLIESVKFTKNSDYDEPFVEVEPVLAQDEPTEEKFRSSSPDEHVDGINSKQVYSCAPAVASKVVSKSVAPATIDEVVPTQPSPKPSCLTPVKKSSGVSSNKTTSEDCKKPKGKKKKKMKKADEEENLTTTAAVATSNKFCLLENASQHPSDKPKQAKNIKKTVTNAQLKAKKQPVRNTIGYKKLDSYLKSKSAAEAALPTEAPLQQHNQHNKKKRVKPKKNKKNIAEGTKGGLVNVQPKTNVYCDKVPVKKQKAPVTEEKVLSKEENHDAGDQGADKQPLSSPNGEGSETAPSTKKKKKKKWYN